MEILGWLVVAVVVFFVVSFAWHSYKMKNDRYYRFKIEESLQDQDLEKKLTQLRQSENPAIRELAKTLGSKGR